MLGNGIGAVLASLEGQYFPLSTRLGFDYTNNMTEFEACAMGIIMAIKHQVKRLNVFGDSVLVIYQLHGEWDTRDPKLIPYHSHVMAMANQGREMTIHIRHQTKMAHYQQLEEAKEYLRESVYHPATIENDKRTLRRLAVGFFLSGVILYKRSADLTLLRCMDNQEAKEIMEEVHEGTFGTNTNGHALAHKILKASYYWTKMESDCCQHVKRCMKC
ncbi:Gypsy retrotransposon integrase-like protein 1, partial [Mucuna pruriens]